VPFLRSVAKVRRVTLAAGAVSTTHRLHRSMRPISVISGAPARHQRNAPATSATARKDSALGDPSASKIDLRHAKAFRSRRPRASSLHDIQSHVANTGRIMPPREPTGSTIYDAPFCHDAALQDLSPGAGPERCIEIGQSTVLILRAVCRARRDWRSAGAGVRSQPEIIGSRDDHYFPRKTSCRITLIAPDRGQYPASKRLPPNDPAPRHDHGQASPRSRGSTGSPSGPPKSAATNRFSVRQPPRPTEPESKPFPNRAFQLSGALSPCGRGRL